MIHTVTKSAATDIGITLLDSSNNPVVGVLFSAVTVQFRKNGVSFTNKTLLSGEWNELGDGIYKLSFAASELNTIGYFRVLVSGTGFVTYRADILIVDDYKTTAEQIIDLKANLALKVNISDADTLFEQQEVRVRALETTLTSLEKRLKTALAALAASK